MAYLTKDDLFEFQKEDIEKLQPSASVLIGNEMGTGKTYEAVALDWFRRQGDRTVKTLVLCNLSQIEVTWAKHFRELTDLNISCYDPKNKSAFIQSLKDPDIQVYIIHWEAFQTRVNVHSAVAGVAWYHVIADECHKMKGRKNQTTVNFKKATKNAIFKTAMSGTPITNKPHDYWSVLNWLWPRWYGSYWNFYKNHVEYEIQYPQGYHKIKGPKNVELILDRIGPFYVRHLKKSRCCDHHPKGVMAYLPDKVYEQVWVDLLPVQRKAYDEMNKELIAWVGENRDKPLIAPVVISKLVRLQQFALAHCDVNFYDEPLGRDMDMEEVVTGTTVTMTEPSSKLDSLMEIIEEHIEEGQQIVVFSQFSQAIRLLGARLQKNGASYALYTGDTKTSERDEIVRGFLDGKISVFAGTIKAGGVGLDLYTASTVVFLDRSWSPAENFQAEDRLHRHGQKNSVRVIDIMARNTIDWGRKQQIDLKWSWIQQLLGDIR